MNRNSVYQISARQILLLAFVSALIAVGATVVIYNFGKVWLSKTDSNVAMAEETPRGISDPSAVTDVGFALTVDVLALTGPTVKFTVAVWLTAIESVVSVAV